MGGGVHPAEWIVPVVGAAHALHNAGAQAVDQPWAKLVTPESRSDRRNEENEAYEQRVQAAQQAERERLALVPRPQTGGEEFESRRRAQAASEVLGRGKRRASQTLTQRESTLSGLAVETL